MQQPEDIAHLYQEFGGRPETYREITRTRAAQQARERWPLISALEELSAGVPPVRQDEASGAPPHAWHAPQRAVPPAPPARTELPGGPVEPTGPLPDAAPAVKPAVSGASASPSLLWGRAALPPAAAAPVAAPAPAAPVAAAPAPPPAAAPTQGGATLQSPSPLSRLARPPAPPEPAAQPAGLQQVFARLLGSRNRA